MRLFVLTSICNKQEVFIICSIGLAFLLQVRICNGLIKSEISNLSFLYILLAEVFCRI